MSPFFYNFTYADLLVPTELSSFNLNSVFWKLNKPQLKNQIPLLF
jgi:hypothetical protein